MSTTSDAEGYGYHRVNDRLMLMRTLRLVCACGMLLLAGQSVAQKSLNKQDYKLLKQAESYFGDQRYDRALPIYLRLVDKAPESDLINFRLGVCYLNSPAEASKAIPYLKKAANTKDPGLYNVRFYLGRAMHMAYRFDDAIEQFNYFSSDNELSPEDEEAVDLYLMYCETAKKLVEHKKNVDIELMGAPISSEWSEYRPLVNPIESIIIFTYRGEKSKGGLRNDKAMPDPNGEYMEDILFSYRVDKKWSDPQNIGDEINTVSHDAALALSVDGQRLLVYKSNKKDKDDIFVSLLSGVNWTRPIRLQGDLNTKYWEGSASIAGDGRTLYFSSDRPGGFGGRDIYTAQLQEDGTWRNIRNLGPKINTPMDEDAPFIHPAGKTLYFSSNGKGSMGGYDIFYSQMSDNGWEQPVNIGYPINTPDDDRYYIVSADGRKGYFSSARAGGIGGHDIYVVTPGSFVKQAELALVIGKVKMNDKPVEATIKLRDVETDELKGLYNANKVTGNYLLTVTPGSKYRLAVEVEGDEVYSEYLNVDSLDTYVKVDHDFQVFTPEYMKEKGISQDDLKTLQAEVEEAVTEQKKSLSESLYSQMADQLAVSRDSTAKYYINIPKTRQTTGADTAVLKAIAQHDIAVKDDHVELGPFSTAREAVDARIRMVAEYPELKNIRLNARMGKQDLSFEDYYEQALANEEKLMQTGSQPFQEEVSKDTARKTAQNDQVNVWEKEVPGVRFKIEIAAVNDTNDFKMDYMNKYGSIKRIQHRDGTWHYSIGDFATLKESEAFRAKIEAEEKEAKNAFVTVFVFGKQKAMPDYVRDPDKVIEEAHREVVEDSLHLAKLIRDNQTEAQNHVKDTTITAQQTLQKDTLIANANAEHQVVKNTHKETATTHEPVAVNTTHKDQQDQNDHLEKAQHTQNQQTDNKNIGTKDQKEQDHVSDQKDRKDEHVITSGEALVFSEPVIFRNILFDFDKSALRQLSRQELDQIRDYLEAHQHVNLIIDGHTDWIGTDEYNMKLGMRRARAAVSYLIRKGIDSDRISLRSFGERRPVAPNANPDGSDNPEGRQLNRRCEFQMKAGQDGNMSIVLKF